MRNSSILTVAFLLAFGVQVATAQVYCDCTSSKREHGCRWLRRANLCVHEEIECKRLGHHGTCNKFDHCKWNFDSRTCTNPLGAPEAYSVGGAEGEEEEEDYGDEEDEEEYDGEDEVDSALYIREEDIDCLLVDCMEPECASDEIVVTPDEECCPICIIGEDEEDYDGEDEEGPVLYIREEDIDCSLVDCMELECASDEIVVTPDEECCPICVIGEDEEDYDGEGEYEDENEVDPAFSNDGEEAYDGEDEVDPVLYIREEDIDCALVDCMEPECGKYEIVVTPDEECCPICVIGEE